MTAGSASKSTINVLLVGATGSLGSRILGALLERSFIHVTVVVRNRDKLSSILSTRRHLWRWTLEPALVSLPEPRLSIIAGDATNSDLLARVIQEKSIRVLVNAAGHVPMFARGRCSPLSSTGKEAVSSENEVVRIVRASIDAIEEVAKSAEAGTAAKRTRGWFIGGMLLLDFPESKESTKHQTREEAPQSLDHYLPLYLHHRPVESILRSSKYVDWTLVCPAKMIPRPQRSNPSPASTMSSDEAKSGPVRKQASSHNPSPTLIASADVPPKWAVWPSLRMVPWGIGPLLEIIANSARYTVAFEDVAEFIVDQIVHEHELQQEQSPSDSGHEHHDQTDILEPLVAINPGTAVEDTREESVWINKKIGLIASSGNT